MDEIMRAFCDAVEAHGWKIVDVVEDDDTINFEFEGWKCSAYLDNLRRNVSMGQKLEDAVGDFVSVILSPRGMSDEPSVRNAGLRFILEQEEVLSPFAAIKKPVSQEVALALVWTDADQERISYLASEDLVSWGLAEQEAWAEAERQMDRLLSQTEIEVSPAAGSHMAFFVTGSPFKASLVAAPSLREHIEPRLGWPILALAPCRDYLLLFPHGADEMIGRLAKRIRREYETSAYPLSPEVFSISDDGIKAIGRFSEPAE